MTQSDSWYRLIDEGEIDSPALLVFPDRVKENIVLAIKMVGDVNRLRPHIKTHKSAGPTNMMLGLGITKFKCATISEAELLARCNAPDVLLAYQPSGPKLKRFIELVKAYPATRFSCLADHLQTAREQSAAFESAGLKINVYLDVNVGMNRTGITPGEGAIGVYEFLSSAAGIQPAGIHAYDGHIREVDILARKRASDEAFVSVTRLKASLEEKGLSVPAIIAGGSPTFPIHAERSGVECSPGTFVYWDKGYMDGCPEQAFQPAAVLMTRVISIISSNRCCTDLGHKSVAAENELGKRVYFLNAEGLNPVGQSEEHLVLESASGMMPSLGDVLYALPFHVCPTVALYERSYTIVDGKCTGEWKNEARDRRINI